MTNDDRLAALVAEPDKDRRWDRLRAFATNETSAARSAGEGALLVRHERSVDPEEARPSKNLRGHDASTCPIGLLTDVAVEQTMVSTSVQQRGEE